MEEEVLDAAVGDKCPTYTPTLTLFLRVVGGKQGVLQIHQAWHFQNCVILWDCVLRKGLKFLLAWPDIWWLYATWLPTSLSSGRGLGFTTSGIAFSQLAFQAAARFKEFLITSWLLQMASYFLIPSYPHPPRSGSVAGCVAEKWRVDTARHIVRRADYRGKRKQSLHLPFDGLTLPALLFVAARQQFMLWFPRSEIQHHHYQCHYVSQACAPLQIRSCSATQQTNIAASLKMFLGSFCPEEMVLPVLPCLDVCILSEVNWLQWAIVVIHVAPFAKCSYHRRQSALQKSSRGFERLGSLLGFPRFILKAQTYKWNV